MDSHHSILEVQVSQNSNREAFFGRNLMVIETTVDVLQNHCDEPDVPAFN